MNEAVKEWQKHKECSVECEHVKRICDSLSPDSATIQLLLPFLQTATEQMVDAISFDVINVISLIDFKEEESDLKRVCDETISLVCLRSSFPRDIQLSISESFSNTSNPLSAKLLLLNHVSKALLRISPPERRQKFTFSILELVFDIILRSSSQNSSKSTTTTTKEQEGLGVNLISVDDLEQDLNKVPLRVIRAVVGFIRQMSSTKNDLTQQERTNLLSLSSLMLSELGQLQSADKIQALVDNLMLSLQELGFLPETFLCLCVKTINSETINETDDFEVEEEESEEETTTSEPRKSKSLPLNYEGIGMALFQSVCIKRVSFMPTIVSPCFILEGSLKCISSMFSKQSLEIQKNAWKLMSTLITPIPRGTLKFSNSNTSEIVMNLMKAMLDCTVHEPNQRERTSRFQIFSSFFGLQSANSRFNSLKQLISASPSSIITCLLVRKLKSEIEHSWPEVSENQDDTAFFCSRKLLEIFPLFMTSNNLSQRNEEILEALNLYRFLLIKDSKTNYTGLWTTAQIAEVDMRFLSPLKGEVQKLREEYSAIQTDDEIKMKISSMETIGLPKISLEEFKRSNMQAILNVTLLEDLVDRIRELAITLSDNRD